MTICLKFEIEKLSVLFEYSPRTDLYILLNSKQHLCLLTKYLNFHDFHSFYTSTTTSKAWPSIYSMHLPLQSRLKAFGGGIQCEQC